MASQFRYNQIQILQHKVKQLQQQIEGLQVLQAIEREQPCDEPSTFHYWSSSSVTFDFIQGDHLTGESAIAAIKKLMTHRGAMAYDDFIIINGVFTSTERNLILKLFPGFCKCIQSGSHIMLE